MNRAHCLIFVVAMSAASPLFAWQEVPTNAPPTNAVTKPSPTAYERLTPGARKLVDEHAKFFVRTADGTLWDRQILLRREELRALAARKKGNPKPSDDERAYGIYRNSFGLSDDELSRAVRSPYNQGQTGLIYGLMKQPRGKDLADPPLLFSVVDDRTLITDEQIRDAVFGKTRMISNPSTVQLLEDGSAVVRVDVAQIDEVGQQVIQTTEYLKLVGYAGVAPVGEVIDKKLTVRTSDEQVYVGAGAQKRRVHVVTFLCEGDPKAELTANVTPAELAEALANGKAALSKFFYRKSVTTRADGTNPETATFSWSRRDLSPHK